MYNEPKNTPQGQPDDTDSAVPLFGLSAITISAVFIGGLFGTLARYLVDTGHPTVAGHFPLDTLLINLSGSLLIGLLVPLTEHVRHRVPELRAFLVVGVLGGWTTYSTLATDAVQLAQHDHIATVLVYLAATVFGGVAAVVLGTATVQRILPR